MQGLGWGDLGASGAPSAKGVVSRFDPGCVKTLRGITALGEFRGCEDWPVIAISENQGMIAVIMGNPVMFPRRRQDGKNPLEPEKTGDVESHSAFRGRTVRVTPFRSRSRYWLFAKRWPIRGYGRRLSSWESQPRRSDRRCAGR
jgi:hypothetical protein